MAAELAMTGGVWELGRALDDREFSIVRQGYDPDEVRAFLADIEVSLSQLEAWAESANARLEITEEKSPVTADIDEAMVAIFEAKERVLKRAQLEADRIEAEATERARVDAEVVAAGIVAEARDEAQRMAEATERARVDAEVVATGIVAEARDEAQRIAEATLATLAPITEESILEATRTEADRLIQNARAEADRLVEDARAEAGAPLTSEPTGSSTEPAVSDRSIGSASVARLLVEMEGIQVELEGVADEDWVPALDDAGSGVEKQSRYQRTSARLPSIGDTASAVFGSMGRIRKRLRDS
jgi:DivIVA domain-containing protein